jgi:hypothetical protein
MMIAHFTLFIFMLHSYQLTFTIMEPLILPGPAPNGSHIAVEDRVHFPFYEDGIPTAHEIAESLACTLLHPENVRVLFHINDAAQRIRHTKEVGSRHLRVCILYNPMDQNHVLFVYECIIPINAKSNPTCRFRTPTAPYLNRFADGVYDIF